MMSVYIPTNVLSVIVQTGEDAYPDEGAGVLLGTLDDGVHTISSALPLNNTFEAEKRARRYMIQPEDMLLAEMQAEQQGLEVIGIFHSHPDHPAEPSEFDREWALPWYAYMITSVHEGVADQTRCWLLDEDRSRFDEVPLVIRSEPKQEHS
jgi:proteasome lid subunit RPN8/RPN11